ncbi:hypothetical protein [Brevibacterium oceani]|uniref:hypothetical protein n=1 Tax=Brevibacterium oceani TaxID=358099 RepID=UPI0015E671CB|nr:hypothetical protein [Brevibacterium oceani]
MPDGIHNWSMTIGEMRAAITDLPDDYEIVLDGADVSDCDIAEMHIDSVYDPALDAPGLLVLTAGQTISEDYHYHPRLDVELEIGTAPRWDETDRTWSRS